MAEQSKFSKANMLAQVLVSPAGRAFLALLLVLIIGALFNADGAFFKIGTHRDTLRQASVYGILACGMTLVILSGGIDLSVGSVLALVSVCCADGDPLELVRLVGGARLPDHRWLLRRRFRSGHGPFGCSTIYRHTFDDGPGSRVGQIRLGWNESFHRDYES